MTAPAEEDSLIQRARALLAQPLAPRQRPTHPTQNTTMTNPITPPPELVHKWADMLSSHSDQAVFTMIAQWGADQELEACCEWLDRRLFGRDEIAELRTARRPKPSSLKERIAAAITNGDERTALSLLNEAMPNV